jgi:predicted TIM-barrel fold metal-dependent hydrolase
MRINGHAHIFNLQTVLSEEALAIMVGRLERLRLHPAVLEAVRRILEDQLRRPEHLVEDELLRRFLGAVGRSSHFQGLLDTSAALPVEVRLLGTDAGSLAVDALKGALDQLSTRLAGRDGSRTTVFDMFETLRLAMQPDIPSVAGRLLVNLGPDDAIVALMMDIVRENEKPRDRQNFLAQLRGTADATLRYPGRVLPFVAVNPTRPDHLAIMRQAVEQMGFVGVKLYPSLGFEVGTPRIAAVLDYCLDADVPVLMHCTATGFFKSKATTDFSHPRHWAALLEKRPGLRVCFAHFGGWGGFSGQDPDQAGWSDVILQLMASHPQVYTDLSYHVDMMTGGEREERYLAGLRDLLADPAYSDRIIFGTDSWLVRLSLPDEVYWRYFETKLGPSLFARIAEAAPRRYLGLPDDQGGGARENIRRHVAWLEQHRTAVGAAPARWVASLSSAVFTPSRTDPHWSPNNRAHVSTYKFFRFDAKQIRPEHVGLGFEGSGKLRLRQLGYWTREHESDALFNQRRQNTAVAMESYLRTNGAGYEGDYDRQSAIDRLFLLLDDGDRTLAEAAAAVDAIFLFPSELI